MALYEHVFLARQDVSNTQVEALTKEYSDIIEQGGGKVTKSEYWGVKSLAYKIKKNRKAHFSLLNIDAPPAAVAEMERRMGISTEIIRFLTVKVEQHETEPSAMMRKSDRDERGDRGDRGGFGGRGGPGGRGGVFRGDRDGGGGRGGFRGDRDSGPRGGEREGSTFRARPPRDGDRPPRDGDRPPRPPREARDTPPAGPAPSTDRNSNSES
jgi:small subunit ribosomal protein S6